MNYVHDSETTWPVHVTVVCCNYAYQQHEILATGHLKFIRRHIKNCDFILRVTIFFASPLPLS